MKPGVPDEHLRWAALYCSDHPPDHITWIGDQADMESCCSYNKKGSMSAEKLRIQKDFDAWRRGHDKFESNLRVVIPSKAWLMGNHDKRVDKLVEDDPRLEGIIGSHMFREHVEDQEYDFHDFMVVAPYDGVYYSHLFHATADGTPSSNSKYNGFSCAQKQLRAFPVSTVAGHRPGLLVAQYRGYGPRVRGRFAVIAGSFYQHDEGYRMPNGNNHFRGIVDICGIKNGNADRIDGISMEYLRATYGKYKS